MYKTLEKLLTLLIFAILIGSTYLTFTNSWLANDINQWQMKINGDAKYYPALTIFILALPLMLLLVPLKLFFKKKNKKE